MQLNIGLFTYLMFALFSLNRGVVRSPLVMRLKKSAAIDQNTLPSGTRVRNLSPVYKPRSENQQLYVKHLQDPAVPVVFGIGPAGCGKTLFACIAAINLLKREKIQKIVLTRPIVPVEEEEIGFLPGSLVSKMDPWTRPIFDILLEYYPQRDLDFMVQSGVIEISPLAYMRGRTFKRSFIIADEMQNSTPNQMLMLTTRIGDGSKMVITGDLKQSDRCQNNGLLDFMNKMHRHRTANAEPFGVEMVEMTYTDIERSPIVAKILSMYSENLRFSSESQSDSNVEAAKRLQTEPFPLTETAKSFPSLQTSEPLMETVSSEGKGSENRRFSDSDSDAALIPSEHITKNMKDAT
jgi:phosphate starvation-inducible PhoH-like protein